MIDFEMFAGDSKNLIISITDASDLTSSTAKWVAKKRIYGTDNLIFKTIGNGITISGNEITIKLLPIDTIEISGTFYHECELTDEQGNISTVKTGYFKIKETGI